MNIENKLNNIQEILKNKDIVSSDGEVIKLHKNIIEDIAKSIVIKEAEIQVEENKSKKEGLEIRKEITEFEQELKNEFGNFYFSFYKNIPKKLDRQFKFRFIFLCTYLSYEDNRLVIKEDNGRLRLIKDNELINLLKLSKREYYKTKKELIDNKLILIDKDKSIHINNYISKVGNIPKQNKRDYIRIFKNTIQDLYNNSLPREHKKLAIFIELLPYIHFQYNIICKNPTCKLMEDIKPLTLKEIMNNLGMSNITTFKRNILGIKINNKKLTMIFEDYDKMMIAINPMLYYKGTNIEALNYLINLFSI